MIKIGLFCASGMSTSMMVKKMIKAAEKRELGVEINAYPESSLAKVLDEGIDVVLLGPQVKFKFPSLKALCEPKGVPIDVINSLDYGMMNGDKVLSAAIELMENK
ncbi:PTS sugar transporter subunit IIB [Vallitalea maricola]|uniref:PTS sugar transporter subunit IIB n=1 Tax=Vallitalea maricola TaxID=3074433 RepID=A0ACB5UHN9_9FIRM|nr:PTS sugar transporter subunit IIB [Vallitalea sp. AN17-2]